MSAVYVYRLIGPGDCLLYVGVTDDFEERLRRHRSTSCFSHLITTTEREAFESREAALEAERIAIITESPLFNDQHNGEPPPLLLDGIGYVIYARARHLGVNLRELATGAGMSKRRLLRLLADPTQPHLTEIRRIADVLGATTGELVEEWEAIA